MAATSQDNMTNSRRREANRLEHKLRVMVDICLSLTDFIAGDFLIVAHDATPAAGWSLFTSVLNPLFFFPQPIGSCSRRLPSFSPLSCLWFLIFSPHLRWITVTLTDSPLISRPPRAPLHAGDGAPCSASWFPWLLCRLRREYIKRVWHFCRWLLGLTSRFALYHFHAKRRKRKEDPSQH